MHTLSLGMLGYECGINCDLFRSYRANGNLFPIEGRMR